jgi:hypothetical protein
MLATMCFASPPRSFTTEGTESTETDWMERKGSDRIRNPFPPTSAASVHSVVKLRIAVAVESRENGV